jgi:UDP-3-O-[3-hydroxymyristoyl] glucosamine N-acyltransferase
LSSQNSEPMGSSIQAKVYTLREIASRIDGTCVGDPEMKITGVAGIQEAVAGEITFLANGRYLSYLKSCQASAIIVGSDTDIGSLSGIRVVNPYLSFLLIVRLFSSPIRDWYQPGQHPTAVISPEATVGENCHVGANVYIGKGSVIGDDTVLMPGVVILDKVTIGKACFIFPNVTIREACGIGNQVIIHCGSVIGSDGYGYAHEGGVHHKIPQIGNVQVEDHVEIGANVTIDRATTSTTRIGSGSKLDNLVHVAHNVNIGKNCLVVAQVGISGSTAMGDNCIVGGQAGLAGHLKIGDRVTIGAQAGVTKDIVTDTRVSGYPARPHEQALKLQALVQRLPDLINRVRELEQELEALKSETGEQKEDFK